MCHLTVRRLIIESVLSMFVASLGHLRHNVGVLSDSLFLNPTRSSKSGPGQRKHVIRKVYWLFIDQQKRKNMFMSTSLLISAVNDAETHQSHRRSIWKVEKTLHISSNYL